MTVVGADRTSTSGPGPHAREIELRRLRAEELAGDERTRLEAHLAGCGRCRARLDGLADEDRAFMQAIPFDRFAGGVERAQRVPARPRAAWRRVLLAPALGVLAAAAFLLVLRGDGDRFNRIKGDAVTAELRIAGADGRQRALAPGQSLRLAPGDRLRVGYRTKEARHLAVLSVDDAGVVSSIYPEQGAALAAPPAAALGYLQGSFELTGKGRERIYVVLAPKPFSVEAAAAVAAEHHRGAGLDPVAAPALGDTTFTWLLEKP